LIRHRQDALEALKNRIDVPPGLPLRAGRLRHARRIRRVDVLKMAAERAVKHGGVREVVNYITLKPTVSPKDVQKRITEALHRHATSTPAAFTSRPRGRR
jgi:hypothetical protein